MPLVVINNEAKQVGNAIEVTPIMCNECNRLAYVVEETYDKLPFFCPFCGKSQTFADDPVNIYVEQETEQTNVRL
jgi:predicted Zn-ribbon and HTH transcriptional regulator